MKLIIYTDGGCRFNSASEPGPAACAFVVFDEQHNYVACMNETLIGTNNVAEYSGLILALKSLQVIRNFIPSSVDRVEFRADSQLIINQMLGTWRVHDRTLIGLFKEARTLSKNLDLFPGFAWVPREENGDADYLCNLALDGTIIDNMFGPLPVKTKVKGISAGQLFRAGRLTEAKPLRVDPEGYALCGSCKARLINCKCPPLEEAV
jgi:ribonuclease HI